MNKRLLLSTALGALLATSAYAQSPSTSSPTQDKTKPATETQQKPSSGAQTNDKSTQTTTQKSPSTPSGSQTSTDTGKSSTSTSDTSKTSPSSSQAQSPSTDTSKSSTSTSDTSKTGTSPTQAQSPATDKSKSSTSTSDTSKTGTSPTQAQSPASDKSKSSTSTSDTSKTGTSPSQAQSPSTNTQAQQPSSQTNVNATVNINDQQRTRVTQSIAKLNVQPVTNVNFAVSVGTVVPTSVRLRTLPPDVVTIVPQYRGYSFFVVRDEIVIVEPRSHKIVTVLPRSGGSVAAAPARSKAAFTDKDRDVVRKHVRSSHAEQRTTGSTATTRTEIRRGERLPDTIVLESFPETVYRDAPVLREYRYIQRDDRTYLVDPGERMVIEEID